MRTNLAVLSLILSALVACSHPATDTPSPPPDDAAPYTWTNSAE